MIRPPSLGSDIIFFHNDIHGVFQIHVHEHVVRQRSKVLVNLIDNARKTDERSVIIKVKLHESAINRWCVWLYGQALRKYGEDPNNALVEIGAVYRFSAEVEDFACANACQDAIRDILVDQYDKVTIGLRPLLEIGAEQNGYSEMLMNILVYGPYAMSGVTRDWLRMLIPKQEFLWVFST
jgi:hypothetical protein